jgi:hypothetical protein
VAVVRRGAGVEDSDEVESHQLEALSSSLRVGDYCPTFAGGVTVRSIAG